MVELYKDPKGDNITTFMSLAHKEDSTTGHNANVTELRKLRQRVVDLENRLKQNVNTLTK